MQNNTATTPYKGALLVSGSLFDKNKMLRRPTPDSDVLASSDDDHDHVPTRIAPSFPVGRRASQGWLQDIGRPNRKPSLPAGTLAGSQPSTPSLDQPQQSQQPQATAPSFPWNTSSFASTPSGSRLQEVLPSPTTATHPAGERALPSPTTEAHEGIGFLLNQHTSPRKQVRSQSYSIGQQDIENSPLGVFSARVRTSVRHRPSKPSLLGGDSAVGLSQLREDDADEIESSNGSEQGIRLPPGYWEREQKQALLKQAAEQNARTRHRTASSPVNQQRRKNTMTSGTRNMSSSDYAIDEHEDSEANMDTPKQSLTRRFSEHVSAWEPESSRLTDNLRMPSWATDNILQTDSLSRRHSFATVGSHQTAFKLSRLENTYEVDETLALPVQRQPEQFDPSSYFQGYGPASRAINASAISAAHPDPHTATKHTAYVPAVLGRPGRRLYIVAFKCSRADIYYLYNNTGLEIRRGDLVIVEGDRGCDLGQVTHAEISLEDAKKFKQEASEEHFRWLVMFSQYSLAGTANDSGMLGALAKANGFPNINRAALVGMGGTLEIETKPKMIKRLAQAHEISKLRDKEGAEAKAKRLGAQKAAEHKLPMEILDAEYQADYHKLTYFYFAETYVNFNDLVTDLFKQYKVRIWMSAVNPASVVNPAGLQVQPPSAIGPGAIIRSKPANANHAVGPGFGAHPSHQQYRRATPPTGQYGSYDDNYTLFANQLPPYPAPQYGQQQYGQQQQWQQTQHYAGNSQQYSRGYGGYPVTGGAYAGATTRGSPMNHGAYHPPTTFSSSPSFNYASSGAPYRGGYLAVSAGPSVSYATGYTGVSTAGAAYNAAYPSAGGWSDAATSSAVPAYAYATADIGSNVMPTWQTHYNPYTPITGPSYEGAASEGYGSYNAGTGMSGSAGPPTSAATGWNTSAASGNGYTVTASGNADPAYIAALQSMSLGK